MIAYLAMLLIAAGLGCWLLAVDAPLWTTVALLLISLLATHFLGLAAERDR